MSFNAKDMTQGGQIASMRIRMFSQIANIILYCLFIFFWILVGLVLWVKISWQTFVNGCIYWWCTTLEGMRDLIRSQPVYEIQYYGKTFRMNAAQVLHDKYMIWCGEQLWSAFVLASVVALVICLITFFVVSWILGRQGKQQSENEITGGRQLTDNPKEVARMLKKDGKDSDIRIGDLPIIRDSEIQNFCLHGTVGAGKSEVIRRLANYARQRGDMVVIYDRSGEFVKSYYDPSIDKILNPLDARCAAWDLWKECLTQPDFDNTANTLIPMGTKEDPFWQGSGRTIFAEAAYLMRNDPNRSYSKLVDTLLSIKIEKLRTFLRNSPAANLVEEKIEKTAISIRAVLTNYVKAIRYLQGIEHNGEPFTIRDWMRGVREDQKNGWLFISSNADTHASLKPVISMWLSIAIRGLLAMGENRNRRVWFFCDELPTLHKLPDLVEILPEARKFGGCYVFGIQSYAQLEDIYGEKAAATLFDVMNTRAFFRSPSHKIAEFAAGEIGEKEHLKASEQYSYGADPVRDGVSTGKDMERQTLVSYSDIQSLPDLTCYVTLPGPYPAVKLSLKYQTRPKVAPEFIPRDINPEMENRLSAVLAAREAEGREMASLFEPDVPEVVSGEDVTQAEQPQQPVSPAINDKKSDAGVNVPAGGIEQELKMKPEEEMEQQLPPGISESGEVVDMAVYEAWQREQNPDIQQKMQRREEVNINVVIQNINAGNKSLDHSEITFRHLAFFCTIYQLHQGDRTDTHSPLVQVKTLPDAGGFVLHRENADVGIEHKLQHQNDSLSCMPGCSLLSIKSALTLCPSNHSSHVSPAGVMILVRPTAITSTRFTFSGNATAFGSLTAWLRLLKNTVVSIICLLMWICLVYIHCGIDTGICQRDIRL